MTFLERWSALSGTSTITGQIIWSMNKLGELAKAAAELLGLL